MSENLFDKAWDEAVGGLHWLKGVIYGEFDETRPLSAIVTDMLVSFVPGMIMVTSARDLTAVIIRLVRHPEKREHVEEWMLLIACVIPLVLPLLLAAVGALAAGVGAVGGVIVGDEAGAAIRAVALMLIREGAYILAEVIGFMKRFVKGDVMALLRKIKFAQYGKVIVEYVGKFIDGLVAVCGKVRAKIYANNWFHVLDSQLERLEAFERELHAVQQAAVKNIPNGLAELDARLAKLLTEALEQDKRLAHPAIPAPRPAPIAPEPRRVPSMPGNPLGTPADTHLPQAPKLTPEEPNLHPEKPKKPRKPRQPTSKNKNIDQTRTTKNADGSTTYYDKQGNAVTYNKDGYPDFSPYSEADVKVQGLKGSIPPDDTLANRAVGLKQTPDGYTWHHVEDGETMQLVPSDIHATFPHSGGASAIRNGG